MYDHRQTQKKTLLGLWLDFCFTNFLDFNCDGYYDGALSARAARARGFTFCVHFYWHAALDRMLHRPTETCAGDPEHCRELDDSPDDPGVANAWDSSGERGAFGGAHPAAAPKLSLYIWPCIRLRSAPCLRTLPPPCYL